MTEDRADKVDAPSTDRHSFAITVGLRRYPSRAVCAPIEGRPGFFERVVLPLVGSGMHCLGALVGRGHGRRGHLYVCRRAIRTLPLLVACLLPWSAQAEPHAPLLPSAAFYAGLPLIFEANAGQMDPMVKFFSRGPGYTLFLTPTEAALALIKSPADAPSKGTLLRMKLVGA